jgi:osmotically inducible protein OsmC
MSTKFLRTASAHWNGNLKEGNGNISTESEVLISQTYSFHTRFGDEMGTNPEELIAAAHAGCYSMAFASTLEKNGYQPDQIETIATCTLSPKETGGFRITKMHLQVNGRVPDIDEQTFKQLSKEADKGCPVSNLLRSGLDIEIEVELENAKASAS